MADHLASGSYRQALRDLRPALWTVAALSAAVNILMLTGPVYMLQVYDRVLTSGSVATLQGLFVVVVILYAFLGIYDFLRTRLLSRAGYRLDTLMAGPAFAYWLQPAEGGGGQAGGPGGSGKVQGQPLRDIDTLRGFMSSPAMLGLFDLPWIPVYVGIVFLVHPWLGLLTLGGALVIALVAILNQRVTDRGITHAMRMEVTERDFTEQSRRAAETVAALGMQERVVERWYEMRLRRLGAGQVSGDRGEGFAAFSKTFRMFLQSATLSMAAYLTIKQEISAGMIIASSVIGGRALAPIDQIIGQWKSVLRAREAHRNCLANFADRPAEAGSSKVRLPAPTGAIKLAGVTLIAPGSGTAASRPRILDQVSFEIEPGDGLGVIGPSASGKSTLARLMAGILRPDAGEIRLDGARPEQWPPGELGRHIGYLPQRVDMLPGSIRDNITRFDPLARDADVITTARLARVHDMILRLPDGYDTQLGRPGMAQPLSGGQIQRLGLARALFGTPKLVILDEPNSNLDQAGDQMLAEAIIELRRRGSTVVVMAHRPGAIAAMNKILILRDGRVMAVGPKEKILGPQPQPGQPHSGQPDSGQPQQGQPQPAPVQPPFPHPAGQLGGVQHNGAQQGGVPQDAQPVFTSRMSAQAAAGGARPAPGFAPAPPPGQQAPAHSSPTPHAAPAASPGVPTPHAPAMQAQSVQVPTMPPIAAEPALQLPASAMVTPAPRDRGTATPMQFNSARAAVFALHSAVRDAATEDQPEAVGPQTASPAFDATSAVDGQPPADGVPSADSPFPADRKPGR